MPAARLGVLLVAALAWPLAAQEGSPESAPAAAEVYERSAREERVRHLDAVRKLADEEERLRNALSAARTRLAESEARRAATERLVADADAALQAIDARSAAARRILETGANAVAAAITRLRARAPDGALPSDLTRPGPLARRVRLLFQVLDRDLAAARRVAVTPKTRGDVLGHEVRLGALATFFVPASGAAAVLEPSGRSLPEGIGAALRDVIRQHAKGGRAALVPIPWWGTP